AVVFGAHGVLGEAAAQGQAFERADGEAETAEVVIQGVRVVVSRGGVDGGEGRLEERQEVGRADGGNEAGVVGGDDVRGEARLDVGAEREGERHGADRLERGHEAVDVEPVAEGDATAGQRAADGTAVQV